MMRAPVDLYFFLLQSYMYSVHVGLVCGVVGGLWEASNKSNHFFYYESFFLESRVQFQNPAELVTT